MKSRSFFYIAYSLFLAVCISLFLWLRIPQYLLYQEQYQLFLFSGDYFIERVSLPGGLADYIGEFVAQFYYVPLYGAILTGLLLTLVQVFLGLACRKSSNKVSAYCLAGLPSILYVGAMGNENVLLSFAAAMMLTSLFLFLDTLRRPSWPMMDTLIVIAGFIMLYWLAGPLAFVYVVGFGILRRSPIATLAGIAAAAVIVVMIQKLWFGQYPLGRMLQGINYFRIPEVYPSILYVIAATMALSPAMTLMNFGRRGVAIFSNVVVSLLLVAAVAYVPTCFNADKTRVFAFDALVRRGNWDEIIEKAKKDRPSDVFSLQALNLALASRGQLAESMFSFDQEGIEGLISRDRLDNTSQLVTAEALFRLGLTNIAFSTTFDLQEAIMNDRKSGRFMKRMAECMLINGNYRVAEKYINILKKSLYYSDWAESASKLIDNDEGIEHHPVYGPLRRNAFRRDAFYSQPEVEKILAMLAVDSYGSNFMAWQYFLASSMLKGDLPTLVAVFNTSDELFQQASIPRHVQEAIAMYWTMGHQSFDGIPFPISPEVQQQTIALAQAAMRHPDNPSAWQQAAPGSFGAYFLRLQRNNQHKSSPTVNYQPTHE